MGLARSCTTVHSRRTQFCEVETKHERMLIASLALVAFAAIVLALRPASGRSQRLGAQRDHAADAVAAASRTTLTQAVNLYVTRAAATTFS